MTNYQIFISYRRERGADLAGRISDTLKGMGYSVFFDVESMHSGTFNTQILEAIDICEDVLLILPPNALDRCVEENDWVRTEIAYAIKKQKNIIPVMMNGFAFPSTLPEDIDNVRNYEGVSVYNEYFDAMVGRIQKLLTCGDPAQNGAGSPSLDEGVRFLNYGMYPKAIECFDKALLKDISNPDIYFYKAVALLKGQRPFLITKPVINEALDLLNTSLAINSKAITHYLIGYIKFDYHHSKMLRATPDYLYHLQVARELGISEAEIRDLFALLRISRPQGF
jgi:tetratricopeptide (TPR) repeat protein